MNDKQQKINDCNEKIKSLETYNEILVNLKTDSKGFVKVSSVTSAGLVTIASLLAHYKFGVDNVSSYAFGGSILSAIAIGAMKLKIDSENSQIGYKISDNLRKLSNLYDELNEIENQNDNDIAPTLIQNRARILKRMQ